MSISRLIGGVRIYLSGCFTGGRFGGVVRLTCVSCVVGVLTGGDTTAGELRAVSYSPTEPLDPSANLPLVLNE